MKEAAFIKQNKPRWEEFEKLVKNSGQAEPDKLAELFIQITDDLSFARTKYPDSRTTNYLNALAGKIHLNIYKNKREDKNRFITFWKYEVPKAMFEARKQLLYSFLIFIIGVIMGLVSSFNDDTFVRLILSDGYVNMTLENIKQGKPTGVYGTMDEANMFFYITWNNIMVSFYVFVYGIMTSVGTGFYLMQNAIMVGSFLGFFSTENLLSHAFPVIMLHGTIELSAIVIAGAAGFTLGNGLIFPGTYSRLDSLKIGAKRGLKIMVGLVPFFVMAGFIESVITRYEFMHWIFKSAIILASAYLIIYYFVIYPTLLKKNGQF
ncbi:MAG TPA: stage II sporulation protein M [Chryseosolibacter sp.]|nr:stage II sporulation protein M [Chryseosolibacter sp.]